ncbi:MAG: lysophospholipid acyltransferase family protein [Gemmatimonadaceae bacterium]|nr:lysophospholipid acyltransferase family protein [Gemmatimonadaceae bacterium]
MSDAGTTRAERRQPPVSTRLRLALLLGDPLIRLLALTWRYEIVNRAPVDALRAEQRPYIYALWHGHLLALTWYHRREGVTTMISEHRDGEIIARLVERWGYRTVRGSTSRGAGRALLGMVRELAGGSVFAITPDGPRGPAGSVQQGVLVASQKARAPIVSMRMDVDRAWHAKGWDRFAIPKPFAKVRITYGDPFVAASADEAEAAKLAAAIGPAIPAGLAK